MDKTYKAPLSKAINIVSISLYALLGLPFIAILYLGIGEIVKGNYIGWIIIAIGFVILLPLALGKLWAPAGYSISSDGIHIKRRIKDIIIPFEEISKAEVMDGSSVFKDSYRLNGCGGFLGVYGSFQCKRLSSFTAYASNDIRVVVLYRKHSEPMVISPDEPEDFVEMLKNTNGIECVIDDVINKASF